ncbi:hypothetical protein KIH41_06690 [Litoribacter ruber]|uniref:Uncharacterized protein n=1 Tax=Litoribacter ruber TaxID=702568 RepID=A0AAP2CFX5_9BACT|nr:MULTISPECIES: hypothetical protein [Litoribacter]MBS9522446.1 hypothetical protein [Litoribacter alkaliphilus]MBT0810966.1 hypothetical protein [Litoribacter ruber]
MGFGMYRVLIVLILMGCLVSCRPGVYHVQRMEVNHQAAPLDISQVMLVNGLNSLPYKEHELFSSTVLRQLRSNGFIDVFSTDELEVELLSAGIRDFSVQRNIDRLYSELGIVYLLQVDIINRKIARTSKLSALSAAGQDVNRRYATLHTPSESKHMVDIQYSLYQVDIADTLAVYQVRAEHKWDNSLRPELIRRDVQKLMDQLNYYTH